MRRAAARRGGEAAAEASLRVRTLRLCESPGKVLLVGEHQERRLLQFLFLQRPRPSGFVVLHATRYTKGTPAAGVERTLSMAMSSSLEMFNRSESELSTT